MGNLLCKSIMGFLAFVAGLSFLGNGLGMFDLQTTHVVGGACLLLFGLSKMACVVTFRLTCNDSSCCEMPSKKPSKKK
jgi:uncharacterized membrane protein